MLSVRKPFGRAYTNQCAHSTLVTHSQIVPTSLADTPCVWHNQLSQAKQIVTLGEIKKIKAVSTVYISTERGSSLSKMSNFTGEKVPKK